MVNELIKIDGGGVALPRTTIRDRIVLANFDDLANWTVKNTDTINMGLDTKHITGINSIKFDKADTAAGDTEALIQNNFNNFIDASRMLPSQMIFSIFYISSLANVVNSFIRIGSDNSNYNQWTWPSELLKANKWNILTKEIKESDFTDVGNGWLQTTISYIALGVTFKLQTDTLTAIRFDSLCFIGK